MSVIMLPVEQRPVLTVREAAAVLGRHKSTIQRACEAGELPGAKLLRGMWMIPKYAIPGWERTDWGAEAEAGLRALSEGE